MKTELYLTWPARRLTLIVLAMGLLATYAVRTEGGSIKLNCWEYDRGNAKVVVNPGRYGDYRDKGPGLMLTGSGKSPFVVEYDVDFPVTAAYKLRVRYASAGVRPLEVQLDSKRVGACCAKKTNNAPPYMDRHPNVYKGLPERTWDMHGAEWEDACEIQVAKGKHTLKFTRNGPPSNLVKIYLETEAAFPKGWKPTKRKLDLGRIPPMYRGIFLPADSVNTATLRLAIADKIETFGSQYPNGSKYLKQLDELEAKMKTAAAGSEQLQAISDGLRLLRRKVMLDHPALKFDKLLFAKRKSRGSSIYTWHHSKGSPGGNLCVLSPVSQSGKVTELVPELDGGVFGRFDLLFDASKVVFCYSKKGAEQYRIYEIDIDPSTGLRVGGKSPRQLTFGGEDEAETLRRYEGNPCGRGYDDIDPCYLPNGKIMFASTRSQRSVLCFPATVTSLHVMDADGKNIRCLSEGQVNEINPCVLDDGRVVYMRWEYIDKGFGNAQSVWAMRPDGSGLDHVYKNTLVRPGAMINVRSIPGSRRIVAVGAGHHGGHWGPVIVIDNRRNRRTAEGMTNLTPEIPYPGMFPIKGNGGRFKEPYPFSEKLFLVSHSPGGVKYEKGAGFGIYVLDAWGNRAELYRDPDFSCLEAIPLRPRRRPTDIPPVDPVEEGKDRKLASMFMLDVYQGMTGIKRGRVKYVRVMEAMNLSWHDTWRAGKQGDSCGLQASAVSQGGDVARKKIYGVATVHEDGSAYFTVPARKNIFFQALDENYMELQRMRTFLNLMPGENRSCIGCHEVRRKAPGFKRANPMAMARPIEALQPQPGDTGPRAVHYAADIQPILDKHCLGCHSGKAPKGDLDLTGELTRLWNRSYENLTKKQLVSYLHCGFGSAHVPAEPPLTFGSHRSKLVERIRKAPCKAKITREDFIRIVTWIDANAPYYGTHEGKKNLKWKDDPDFRPLPVAGK